MVVGARCVCAPIFCAHWCISRAQLDRYLRHLKDGYHELPGSAVPRLPRPTKKKDFVVTWFQEYAAEVTEKLPDCDKILLPRMVWKDLYSQFVDDMRAAGHGNEDICGVDYFRQTFDTAEELADMEMTTYKRNFAKCQECVRCSSAVTAALKAHNAYEVEKAKAARLTHYMLARSDKLHYWQQRFQVLSSV